MELIELIDKAWKNLNNIGIYTNQDFEKAKKKELDIGIFTMKLLNQDSKD